MPLSDYAPPLATQLPSGRGVQPVSGSISTVPSGIYPATWASPSTSYDARAYSDVEVQLTGTFSAYTPQRSLDGTNFVNCNAYDKDGNALSSITTAGIYRLPGNGYLKLTSGSGATVTIRVGG